MVKFIKGPMAMKQINSIVVEVGGIGLEIFVPGNSEFFLQKEGDIVFVYTEMIVREDSMTLYGFADLSSLDLFKMLITVSGVGAKAGMAIFSSMPPTDIKNAILYDDLEVLTRANGIGKKTAQRIILELKDKLGSITDDFASNTINSGGLVNSLDNKSEAINALMELGYQRGEATGLIESVKGDELTIEEYIKGALRKA